MPAKDRQSAGRSIVTVEQAERSGYPHAGVGQARERQE